MKLYALFLLPMCFAFDYDHVLSTPPKVLWNETNQDKLKKDLFINYDKHARPHEPGSVTNIRLGLTVLHIETNEPKLRLTVHALVKVFWDDPKLKWSKDDYGGIDILRVADHELWHPDLYLFNSVLGGEPVFRFGNPNALLYSTGEVQIVLRAKQTVMCQFDLRLWPFDQQRCNLTYASWVLTRDSVKYSLDSNVEVDTTFPFNTWTVSNTSAEVTKTKHYRINYTLSLVRNPNTYIAICITPVVVSTLLVLTQFWLPPGSRPKTYLNGFHIITFTFHLFYFMDRIGRATQQLPLIVLFYTFNLYAVSLVFAADILGAAVTKSKKIGFLEAWVQSNVARRLPAIFFAKQDCAVDQKQNVNEQLLSDEAEGTVQQDQDYFLATFLNRVMFLIYSLIMCISVFSLR